jgi:putative SOS response-associated peptidase YedK
MCGRYVLKTSALDLERELHLEGTPVVEARYNLAPLQAAPILLGFGPRQLTQARWGLLPRWAKDGRLASRLINARAETLAETNAFRDLLADHRCLVPCDGFYEWTRDGRQRTPHYIHAATPRLLTMAGLWSSWTSPEGLEVVTFTVVTTSANGTVRPLHDRMPVFLEGAGRETWLRGPYQAAAPLLVPWAGAPLAEYQVGRAVNSVAVDDPRCLEPATAVQLSLL